MQPPIDQKERDLAINPTESFIVQAPAGSGKTELLVQRYLMLLASACKQPEEIIAITFTRKAATEMRHRILSALEAAQTNIADTSKTLDLARNAGQKNIESKWKILENPNRLRIMTIDAFCKSITEQMPLLAKFGMAPSISSDANEYYQQAARRLLNSLEENEPWSPALAALLLHLDNKIDVVENLFIRMLAKREQWLPHIITAKNNSNQLRTILESSLQHIIEDSLINAAQKIPNDLAPEIINLVAYAAKNLPDSKKASPIIFCQNLNKIPNPSADELPKWRGIATLLLTGKFDWRKKVTNNEGFPANKENKSYKDRIEMLLASLSEDENLRQAFQDILELPTATYNASQWQALAALIELLPILAAQLAIVFREIGTVDFPQISQAAITALGEIESPSELALKLDYQIRHLLVDEFQDTSSLQFKLLELITAGWQADDGRTLFLVGDPMQSIYSFRQAEVGLFIRAQTSGINQIHLKPLTLQVNFRSNAALINWFNQCFSGIFPKRNNINTSAISFSSSIAKNQENLNTAAVNIHSFIDADEMVQAHEIANIIQTVKSTQPDASIAILVRARNHLAKILPALSAAGIAYQGVEIQKLSHASVVQDLMMLTFAILQPADRLAWLSCLRAPWCGLNLTDLHIVAIHSQHTIIWNAILLPEIQQLLSTDGQMRISKFIASIAPVLLNKQRYLLRDAIQLAWQNLEGEIGLLSTGEHSAVEGFFKVLGEFEWNDLIANRKLLQNQLEQKYIQPPSIQNSTVKIMTIHHAKGLEFDVVILPYLERSKKTNANELLLWHELPRLKGENDLVFAPIKSSYDINDSIYRYLKNQESEKNSNEEIRLLYVAATRAKMQLHLLGTVKTELVEDAKQIKLPRQSFLNLLWPIVLDDFTKALYNTPEEKHEAVKLSFHYPKLRRIKTEYFLNSNKLTQDDNHLPLLARSIDVELEDSLPRNIGKFIHYILYQLATENLDKLNLQQFKNHYSSRLNNFGILSEQAESALHLAELAINNVLNDSRGRWILEQHSEACSEYALSARKDNLIQSYIIDRTFIDNEGKRWIIDFKTNLYQTQPRDKFINEQKQIYKNQLDTYAEIYSQIETKPIHLGLYFPLFLGWCEWQYQPEKLDTICNQ